MNIIEKIQYVKHKLSTGAHTIDDKIIIYIEHRTNNELWYNCIFCITILTTAFLKPPSDKDNVATSTIVQNWWPLYYISMNVDSIGGLSKRFSSRQ